MEGNVLHYPLSTDDTGLADFFSNLRPLWMNFQSQVVSYSETLTSQVRQFLLQDVRALGRAADIHLGLASRPGTVPTLKGVRHLGGQGFIHQVNGTAPKSGTCQPCAITTR